MLSLPIKRLLPRSLYGRAALILLVPIVTIQLVVSFSFIQRLYEDVTVQMTQNMVPQLRLLLKTAEIQSSEIQPRASDLGIVAEFSSDAMNSRIRFYDLSGRAIRDTLVANVPSIEAVDLVADRKWVFVKLDSASGPIVLSFPRSRVSARNPHQLLVLMLATGILMTIIAYAFLRNQLKPIKRLANAAEAFGKGQVVPYYPTGANEVRSAGSAFLNMRSRIERQSQQRTLMLSGVSHDLRTPLTRMKLGLSMQEASPETDALLTDVKDMENLITAFLDFARADATEELAETELVSLLREIAENAKRAGKDVSLGEIPSCSIMLRVRPLALKRALENLSGNATRYGTRARLSLEALEGSVVFRIEDDGPGIPEDLREEALKPFARLDASRNQNKGSGVGLGLAIAADIARTHGGLLRLGDSLELSGLCADLVLPR